MPLVAKNFLWLWRRPLSGPVSKRDEDAAPRAHAASIARQHHESNLRGAHPVCLMLVLAIIVWQSIEVSNAFAAAVSSPLWIVPYAAWSALLFVVGFVLAERNGQESGRAFLNYLLVVAFIPLLIAVSAAAFIIG